MRTANRNKSTTGAWYVVHVLTGEEERALREILQADESRVLQEVFIPRCAFGVYDEKAKRWNSEKRVMFPGYLVAVSQKPQDVERVLKATKMYARALGDGNGAVRMADDEVAFLDSFTKRGHRTIPMSEGLVEEGGRVVITDGPLVGREAQIVKVLHRKKRAVIRVKFCGRETETEVGLHVVRRRRSKSESVRGGASRASTCRSEKMPSGD